MAVAKFSVGDRVESLRRVGDFGGVGSIGTIVSNYGGICSDYEVEFDENIGGWGEGARHWLVDDRDLAPIEDPIEYNIEDLFNERGEYRA